MVKFSIIVVCLNAGNDIRTTVENLLQQTYCDFEIIVKDGGSVDGSIDTLPIDKRIRLIQKRDSSIYDAMNQAISEANGEYIIFINAGDGLYAKETLAQVSKEIRGKTADLYYGHSFNLRFGVVDTVPQKLTKYFCYRSMICHQATVYRTAMLKKRSYDITYKVGADRERMMYSVIRENANCEYIAVTVSLFKSGGLSSSQKGQMIARVEDERLKQTYFSLKERVAFSFVHKLTLPGLRKKIALHPRFHDLYRRLVLTLYRTKPNE